VAAGNGPTAGGSTGAPLGAGTTAPPGVAVPAASAASMAAGAGDLAQGAPAAGSSRTQAAPGGDAPAKDGNEASATPFNSAERTFVQTAAGLGLYEMAAAKLGQEHAKSPAVKDFARRIERGHAKAQEQLQQLAGRHRIDLPGQMPPDRQTVIERLERSEPFDTAFVNTVGVQDHQSSIERFEKAARDAKDPELKAWIQQNLTSLRTHLAQARKLPGAHSR
jgi:putative membrane protein